MSQIVSIGSGVIPPGTYVETLTGNSGTAVADGSGNINTLGSSGITTTGAGSTMTIELDIPVSIAHGGTNATSFTQSNGIVTYNGTSLVNYAGPQIDSSGRMINTTQPAFLYYQDAVANNVTGDGTNYTLGSSVALTQLYDQGSNCTTAGVFTAPKTGKYLFTINVLLQQCTTSNSTAIQLVTTARTFTEYNNGGAFTGNNGYCVTVIAPMTAGDTATARAVASGTSKVVDVYGAAGDARTHFSGYLVC